MRKARVVELTLEMVEAYSAKNPPLCRICDPKVAAFLADGNTYGDYSHIVELSPEAAECFVNTLNGDEDDWERPADDEELVLNGLLEVSPEVARFLGGYSRGALQLDEVDWLRCFSNGDTITDLEWQIDPPVNRDHRIFALYDRAGHRLCCRDSY